MAGTQLGQVRNQLTVMQSQNQYIAGPDVDLSRAKVVEVHQTAVTVSDCELDPSYLASGPTSHAITRPSSVRNLLRVSLQLIDGAWKVTALTTVGTGCKTA
jgi:hypothetical protein